MYIFNKLMNIGSLEIGLGDYLGTFYITFLSHFICFPLISNFFVASAHAILFIAAIGAIFSATDSVCTLQVQTKIFLHYPFLFNTCWWLHLGSNLMFELICRFLIRMRRHYYTASSLGKELSMMLLLLCSSMLFRALIFPISTQKRLFSSLAISCTCFSQAPCLEYWYFDFSPHTFTSACRNSVSWLNCCLTKYVCFTKLQAGLLSAYIIKKLYFGRSVQSGSVTLCSILSPKKCWILTRYWVHSILVLWSSDLVNCLFLT